MLAVALIAASAVVIGSFGDRLGRRRRSPSSLIASGLVVGSPLPAQRHQPERTLLVLVGGATTAQLDRRMAMG